MWFSELPGDKLIVDLIRADLAAGRGLTDPVWVLLDEDDGREVVANGTHRVVACLLEGAPVPFQLSEASPFRPDPTARWYGCRIRVSPPSGMDVETFVDEVLFSALRSMRVNGHWVEAPVMTYSHSEGMLTCGYELPSDLAEVFPALATQWCLQLGHEIEFLSFELDGEMNAEDNE